MDTSDQAAREVAHVISRALADADISQRDAATRTGIPLTTLSRRLTGGSPFLSTELFRLAALLDVPLSTLVVTAETRDAQVSA